MKRILVIEDQEDLRENLLWMLEEEGYEVACATNGREGLERLAHVAPDLVLCDRLMPDVDGTQVLAGVRARPELAHVPFVFLTARAEKDDIRGGLEAGANAYLTKPFTMDDVIGTLQRLLEG